MYSGARPGAVPRTEGAGSRTEPGQTIVSEPLTTPSIHRKERLYLSPVPPAQPEGITYPPIDELLDATDSKYSLVIYAAKRARQINAYYSQLGEGLLEYVGPLVETAAQEKPLSIALREINAGLLTHAEGE